MYGGVPPVAPEEQVYGGEERQEFRAVKFITLPITADFGVHVKSTLSGEAERAVKKGIWAKTTTYTMMPMRNAL